MLGMKMNLKSSWKKKQEEERVKKSGIDKEMELEADMMVRDLERNDSKYSDIDVIVEKKAK